MAIYTARIVEIVHEKRLVTFATDDADINAIHDAAIEAATEQENKPTLLGVMERHVHDIRPTNA